MPKFNLQVADVVYRIRGRDLRKMIEATGVSMSEVARTAGYSGPSHLCHLCGMDYKDIPGQYLLPILQALAEYGVNVSGWKRLGDYGADY